MGFTMKIFLLNAFFVVYFCDMIATKSVSHPELKATSDHMWNNRENTFTNILYNAIGGDWGLIEELLDLVDRSSSEEYINMNYKAVWLLLQKNTSILHSKKIFKFSNHVEKNVYLVEEFKMNVKLGVINETAQFLTELLYPVNSTDTQLTDAIFEYLNTLNDTALGIMFNRLYDNLQGGRGPVSIANRLYILPFSNNQLTIAYMELKRRNESRTDQKAIEAIYQNIAELCVRDGMSLRDKLLLKADSIRMRSARYSYLPVIPYYVGLCRNVTNICAPAEEPVNFQVERSKSSDGKGNFLYAFKIPGVGYISWKNMSASITNEPVWWKATSGRIYTFTNSGRSLTVRDFRSSEEVISVFQNPTLQCNWDIELGN